MAYDIQGNMGPKPYHFLIVNNCVILEETLEFVSMDKCGDIVHLDYKIYVPPPTALAEN